jgi:hypothetical protein
MEEKDMKTGKVLKWEEFREVCRMDAYSWHNSGYKANEITAEEILDEYPVDYFEDDEGKDYFDDERFFTPEEFARKTLEYLRGLEEEVVCQ